VIITLRILRRIMGIGTHKNDTLICLNDFAFTNALVKQGSRRDVFRPHPRRNGEEVFKEEQGKGEQNSIRKICVEIIDEGNCVCTLGKTDGDLNNTQTKAHCVVTGTLNKPHGRSAEGSLRVRVKMSPMAHPTDAPIEKNREHETCDGLSRMLEKCFRDARALDLESLCVSAGRYVWHLRLDVTLLNHGGDLPLAVSIGANCALGSFRRYECSIDNETNRVTFHEERESVKLQLMHHPVAVRFAFYDGSNSKGSGIDEDEESKENADEEDENNKPHQKYGVLVDATVEEEACAIGFATVAVNEHGETCFSTMDFMGERLGKSVTRGVDATALAGVHSTASDVAKVVCKEMKEAHEVFEQKRLEEKTRRRKYDPDALERAAMKVGEDEEKEDVIKDALLEDAEAMDAEARASEDSSDEEEDDDAEEKEHVPLVSLKPPSKNASSSSSSEEEEEEEEEEEKSSDVEGDDIDDMFDKAEKKQAKKRAKIAAKTWDEALPGGGKNLSDAVLKKKKLNKKKAPAKAKKLTSSKK
jgi:exosome complex component RRP45